MSDIALRVDAMRYLTQKLGRVNTEKFITLISEDSFDYTKWREDLFEEMSLEELAQKAQKYCDDNK